MKLQMIRRDDLEQRLKDQLFFKTRFDDKSKQNDFTMAAAAATVVSDLFAWLETLDNNESSD